VKASDLEIDLRENVLTLTGRVTTPGTAKESNVLREYRPGTFFRQFTLSERSISRRSTRSSTTAS